jgi:hypothetical protein
MTSFGGFEERAGPMPIGRPCRRDGFTRSIVRPAAADVHDL